MNDLVAFDGGYALDLFEVVDSVADVLAFGDADGDAGDDAVVVDEFCAIGFDRRQHGCQHGRQDGNYRFHTPL